MNKTLPAILPAILAALAIALASGASPALGSPAAAPGPAEALPGVTPAMRSAAFWTGKLADRNRLIMDRGGIDAFNREFCTVCSNRECSRSWGNASGFNARVRNWRSVLFENVPRVENSQAANPNFTPADQGRVPEIVTQTFETSPAPLSFDDVPDTEPGTPADDQGAPVHRQAAVQTPPAPNPAPAVPQVNTPFQQPAMLSGSPPQEQAQAPGSVFVFDDD